MLCRQQKDDDDVIDISDTDTKAEGYKPAINPYNTALLMMSFSSKPISKTKGKQKAITVPIQDRHAM